MSVNYPLGTVTPELGLSLYGQDEVLADNFILIDKFASTGIVGGVGISGGNTLGQTGASTGIVYLQGGNNVTLSGTSNTIVIQGGAGGSGGGIAASLSGNTSGALALVSTGTLILAGGNNITLSQNGQSVTISGPNTVSQSVQTQGSVLINGSSGSIVLTAGNNITLSQSASTITVSAAAQTVQTQNLVSINGSTGSISFVAGNNITLSQSASTITVSAFNQSVQTQNCVDLTLGGNTSGTLALINSGTAFLAGGNNITLSQNGQSITISGPNTVAQSNQTLGIYASSGTLGTTSSTYDARSLSIVGSGVLNVGWSNSSLVLSVPSGGGAGFTAGISGGNTSGDTGTTSNELVLAGGNNITLSGASGAGGLSVTVSGPSSFTNSVYWPQPDYADVVTSTFSNWGSSNQYFWPFQMRGYVTATQVNLLLNLSVSTSSNSSHAAAFSYSLGIFTRSGSTLSTVSSVATNFQYSNTGNQSTASLSGCRALSAAFNVNLTPGDYYIGVRFNSASTNANWGTWTLPHALYSAFGGYSGYFGGAANNSLQMDIGLGSVSVTGWQTSMALSSFSGTANGRIYRVQLLNFTA